MTHRQFVAITTALFVLLALFLLYLSARLFTPFFKSLPVEILIVLPFATITLTIVIVYIFRRKLFDL